MDTHKFEYNSCETCGADSGKCGLLVGKVGLPDECQNCSESREQGKIILHAHLQRTSEQIKRMTDKLFNSILVLYAVRNSDGQYFRAKGYGGGGATWVDDINKAKIYGKIGQARSRVTWFANNYPEYPTPDLMKLTVTTIEIMDEKKRVEKAQQKKLTEEAARVKRNAERELKEAQQRVTDAQESLKRLKNK